MPKHWLLGEETHCGRGYFSLQRFDGKWSAIRYACNEYDLTAAEERALWDGRVEFELVRAKQLQCIALELVGCDCKQPEVHDG